MMRGLLLTGLLLTQTPASVAPPPAPPAPVLTDLHRAQLEAYLAAVRILELEVELRQIALREQRARLEVALAAAYPGYTFDWRAGALMPAPKKDVQP
jgi:hypothetical protein